MEELNQRHQIALQEADNVNQKALHTAGQLDALNALANRNGDAEEWFQQQLKNLPAVVQNLTNHRNSLEKNAHMLEGAKDNMNWARQLAELGDG